MPDDIVTRLRNLCVPDDSKWLESMPTDRLMLEAADEIERLRAELQRWKTCEMVTESVCGWDIDKTYCDKCKGGA